MRLCDVDGCDEKHHGNGYCSTHNTRNNLTGSPTTPFIMSKREEHEEFFYKAKSAETDDCIIWPFGKKNNYGVISVKGSTTRQVGVHRRMTIEVHGLPPEGKEDAAHDPENCTSKLCINPRHLRWASRQENMLDYHRKEKIK